MAKCMVCGKPAQPCAPLTFCDECKHTKKADEIRKRHEEWFKEIVASRSRIRREEYLTRLLCEKSNPNSLKCNRLKGHKGYCAFIEQDKGNPHLIHSTIFQSGWVDQGKTPKRRALLISLFSIFSLISFGFLFSGVTQLVWFGLTGLLIIFSFIGTEYGIIGMWRDYMEELKK